MYIYIICQLIIINYVLIHTGVIVDKFLVDILKIFDWNLAALVAV